jgi:hypothetical protein
MAHGGRNNPQKNCSPIVMHSRSDTNVTHNLTTTSSTTPDFPIEPVTLIPQGIDVQELFFQSVIRTHSALSQFEKPGRQLNQPLDFKNLQEQPQYIGLAKNPLGSNITDPSEALILSVGGSIIPPSPPATSPLSSREESLDEGSSFSLTI